MSNKSWFKKGCVSLNKGKKASAETRLKQSLAKKGKVSYRKCRSLVEEYGLERAEEIRQKLISSHVGKVLDQGSNWQGGKTEYKYTFHEARENIKNRERFCRICGNNRMKLHAHHIDYNKENDSELNLIRLCMSCHMKTNWHRDFWSTVLPIFMNYWNIGRIGV